MFASGQASPPISLLYVDDEPALLDLGKLFLERNHDFSVTTSESGADVIRLLSERSFDAVISDYQMPGMDGIALLHYIREIGYTIPFIIFTGKGREEVAIEALNSGADFYLQKGGDPKSQFAELSNKIRYAVARRRNEVALRESEERYRNVVEDMDEFICRFLPDGKILFANDAYCNYFGMTPADLIGSRFKPTIHPDDIETVKQLFTSLTADHPSGTIEERVIRSDGTILWHRWSTRAIFDTNGCLCEYQSVGRDITDLMQRDLELKRTNDELLAANEELRATDEELREQYNEIMAAQNDLAISGARYRTIFEYTSAASIIIEEDTTITLANTAFEELSGLPKDDVIGMSWTKFVSPSDRERMVGYHDLRRRGSITPPQSYDFTFIDGRGGSHMTHLTVGLIPGTRQSVASFYDITERFLMEEAIRKSEEQYRMITENMTETVSVMDLSMKFLYVSPSIKALRGFTAEETMQQSLSDIMTPASLKIALKTFAEEIQLEAMGTADPERVIMLDVEEYHKDGSTFWVNNTLKFLRDKDGKPTSILIVSRDISCQKRAENLLKERDLFNSTLIKSLPDYVLLTGSDGRIIYINQPAANALGYSIDEVIGSHVLSFVAEEYHDEVIRRFVERREGDEIPPYEIEIISRTKTRSLVIVKGALIRHNDILTTLLVLTDITDRKKAEEALRYANRKLHLLSSVTRHDILNKLTALRGYLTLITDYSDDQTQMKYIHKVEEAANAIQRHIEFSRQYEKLGIADPTWQEISSLVSEIQSDLFILQNECQNLSVLADPMLEKVFLNLMDNTIRHGEGATQVRLSCEVNDQICRIIWEDDGVGVPDDLKEKIFSPGVGKNTGFGLFLSREILGITGITIRERGISGDGARFEMAVPHDMWRIESR